MRHLVSFLRSPLGYIVNLVATITAHTGAPACADRWICAACETLCLRDGVQDDMLF
jgi:hypothetical protein